MRRASAAGSSSRRLARPHLPLCSCKGGLSHTVSRNPSLCRQVLLPPPLLSRPSRSRALAVAVSDGHPEGILARCDPANGLRSRVSDANRSNNAARLWIALRYGFIDLVSDPQVA